MNVYDRYLMSEHGEMIDRAIERLPERINRLRTSEQLSALELAEICNVSQRTIHQWESSNRKPSLASAAKLAAVFDMTIDELLLGA